jgi:hypothetical protein
MKRAGSLEAAISRSLAMATSGSTTKRRMAPPISVERWPTSSSGVALSSISEHACSLIMVIRPSASAMMMPSGALATSASSREDSVLPRSSAARMRVTSRPVISTAIARPLRKRSVAWPWIVR